MWAGAAVWSEPVNAALAELGLDEFFVGYVTGRAAPLGEVPGAVVAAAFGVFEPGVIATMWATGRATGKLPELIAERDRATAASLLAMLRGCASEADVLQVAEVLGRAVAAVDGTGRPLFAALRAQPRLTDAVVAQLDAWSQACIEGGAFPVDPRKRAAASPGTRTRASCTTLDGPVACGSMTA
jgi:hypothetical protein